MGIDFDGLKTYLPQYLAEEFNITDLRRNFPCPVCGSGQKTPCCSYDARTDRIKCFSCEWTGDIFDLMQEHEKKTVSEAARSLAERFSASPVKYTNKEKPAVETPLQDFTEYIERCASDQNAPTYFLKRGLSMEVIKKYWLGFDNVKQLAIIPYNNHFFIGRYTVENQFKYHRPKGTQKTEPFNAARLMEQNQQPLWVAEGEINALSIETLNKPAVALGSSADWRILISFIDKYNIKKPLLVCLDNDEAGVKAQDQLCEELKKRNIKYKSISFPFTGKDFNDILTTGGETLSNFLNNIEQQFNNELKNNSLRSSNGLNALDSFLGKVSDPDFKPTPTGFKTLDNRLGGGLYSGLVTIMAAPSEGKTTLTMQLCENIAEQGERDLLVFSFEMSKEQLIAKTISRLSYEHSNQNPNSSLTALEVMQSYKAGAMVEGAKFMSREAAESRYREKIAPSVFIIDDCEPTTAGIMAKIAEYEATLQPVKKKAPVVMIDYMQLLDTGSKDFVAGCKDITLALKQYAIQKDTIVFAISSVNRESQNSGTSMTSGYGSSFAEYGSDYMLTIDFTAIKKKLPYESKEELKQQPIREMTVTIQKNRMGVTGEMIDFYYAAAYNHFTDQPNEEQLAANVKRLGEGRKGGKTF